MQVNPEKVKQRKEKLTKQVDELQHEIDEKLETKETLEDDDEFQFLLRENQEKQRVARTKIEMLTEIEGLLDN